MLATRCFRYLDLGIVTAMTAALAFAAPTTPASVREPALAMPEPAPEPLKMEQRIVRSISCGDPQITTLVFKGRLHALEADTLATFHFQFADLPDSYTVMTGARGDFEVRVPRAELGVTDLCDLPTSGRHGSFKDAQLSVEYTLSFER